MTTPAVQLEQVETFDRWQCPVCQTKPSDRYTIDHQDTLTLSDHVEIDDTRLYPGFMTMTCPACRATLYGVEITVLSDPRPDTAFEPDGCWTVSQTTKFVARCDELKWDYTHFAGITCDDGHTAAWIGLHFIGPFSDFNAARVSADWLAGAVNDYDVTTNMG